MNNCTFADNRGTAIRYLASITGDLTVTNCVLALPPGGTAITVWGPGDANINVNHSLIEGGWEGTGNIDAAPQFVAAGFWDENGTPGDPTDDTFFPGDYRLTDASPAIDAGDAAFEPAPGSVDLDGHLRRWDGDLDGQRTVDMGAYEFRARPYGDVNCDGDVDTFDIDAFVAALGVAGDQGRFSDLYPGCDLLTADLNLDGEVDTFDVDAFIDAVCAAMR